MYETRQREIAAEMKRREHQLRTDFVEKVKVKEAEIRQAEEDLQRKRQRLQQTLSGEMAQLDAEEAVRGQGRLKLPPRQRQRNQHPPLLGVPQALIEAEKALENEKEELAAREREDAASGKSKKKGKRSTDKH
jgi:hypothetical protein